MVARFEEHALSHPDDRAVVAGANVLTYRELNETANRLAWELRVAGAGPETTIGVRTRRDAHMAVAVLAVAKAGACFLPLDPDHPLDRQAFLLRDGGARLVLESLGVPAADLGLPVVRTDAPSLLERPATDPPVLASGDNLLYVLYTSGSTGVPKGIAMHRDPQVDQMEWSASTYRDRPVALHYFPITSDVGYFELFAAWWSGGTVVIADEAQRLDVAALAELLVRHRVDKMLLPVVALDRLARHLEEQGGALPSLREVITTGERQVITPPIRRMFAAMPQVVLDNHYGSTEVNVVTAPRLRAPSAQWPEIPPVGRPVGKARIYVLDDDLLPCPIGVVGQIHVGGPPPARGYAGRSVLTAAAFVPDPFSPVPGARMYRIGDLGRWRPDGTLECLGRLDFQVKVHGYRVEPGEIEAVLRERPDVAEVAVVPAEPGADDPRLVAYVVADGPPASEAELRTALAARLPTHMVPRAFVFLDRFPLSANGKLDRKRLPAPVADAAGESRPLTATESAVAEVWATVLGVDGIGAHDDFFGLGGHSLLVAQVVHRIRAALEVELPLQALFETPRLAALAARIDQETGAALPKLRSSSSTGLVPLSYSQRRMWFLDRMYPGSSMYHNALALRLRGPLDIAALTAALDGMAQRHAVLRTTYPVVDAEPHQLVDQAARPPLRRVDLRELPEGERESAARGVIEEERVRRIDLAAGPVARHVLLALGDEDHVLCLVAHHMITDRGTDSLYVRGLAERYAGAVTSGEPSLTYADYARWQRELETAGVFEPQLDHWQSELDGAPPVLELATDFERPATLEEIQRTGRTHQLELPGTTVTGLTGLSRDTNATLFMTTLALFGLTLSTHTLRGQDDIVVGVPVEGRVDPRLDDVMGMFVNTLPIRVRCTPDRTFRELLRAVRDTALGAFGNQDLPFEHLVERLRPERDLSRGPLFQALFQLQHADPADHVVRGLGIEPFETLGATARFDLSMGLVHTGGTVRGVLSYPAALFAPDTIARLADRFARLAAQVVTNPDVPIRELAAVPQAEWDAVLRQWNDTTHPVPATTLPALIEQRAALAPDDVAVEYAGVELTYAGLNARANALARRLVQRGAGPERVIAVLLRRSADLLPALLAVLKSGAAYLPVDPDHPRGRVADLLSDSAPVLTLTTRADLDLVPEHGDVLVLDDPEEEMARHDLTDADRSSPLGPENAAYVMYTSGSTGRPKGVVVSHESVVNRLLWTQDRFGLDGTDVVLQKTPLTFDVSVWELFWPLVAGSRLVVAEPGGHADPAYLARLIRDRGVTTAHFVPSVLRIFLEERGVAGRTSLRRVLCSGEALTPVLRDEFHRLVDAELHNLYGPTEAAIDVTHHWCELPEGDVPIGRPVWNTRLYVLDETLRPVNPGTAGELHIGGVQVARGYLGDQRATAERFVPDPFGPPGAVLYRTGDLVRLGRDGALRYLGRLDDQVKIRGVRVEPAEIEQVLQRHEGVLTAAVMPLPDAQGQLELVAYVVAPPEITPAVLDVFVRAKLPASMSPARYVVLDELPLTTSGKLNRRALPAPAAGTGGRRPRTPVEDVLCEIFRQALGVTNVSVDDSFFTLGGHSLSAVRLTARIRSALGVEVDLRTVFTSPTPAALARVVAAGAAAPHRSPAPVVRPDRVPLTHAQRRLWFLARLEERSTAYHMPTAFRLHGEVDAGALCSALDDVVARHESLRTVFPDVDGVAFQRVLESGPRLDVVATDQESLAADLVAAAAHRFDLAQEPPLRAWLFEAGPDERVLFLLLHHIGFDGWSYGPLLREVSAAYEARLAGRAPVWPALPVQYADYALWQQEVLENGVLEAQLAHWTAELADLPARLELPYGSPGRPAGAGSVPLTVGPDLHSRIGALAESSGATVFMVVQAALAALLTRFGAGTDIPIGSPIAGRADEKLNELIGLFVNTLVLRTDTSGDPEFRDLLGRVRAADLAAYAHPDVPFELLVERLNPERSTGTHPLFQVMLSFHNAGDRPELVLPGVTCELLPPAETEVKFDLSIDLAERRDPGGAPAGLIGRIAYQAEAFEDETARALADGLVRMLEAVTARPFVRIGDVDLVGEEWLRHNHFDTKTPLPATTPIALFEDAAARCPDVIAVVCGDHEITYRELDAAAGRLARSLAAKGAGPGETVAIALPRSVESVVAILAVAKTGATFLTLDQNAPAQWREHVLADAAPVVVLGESDVLPDDDLPEVDSPAGMPGPVAYLVYTSGSTGLPKPVAGTNVSLVNRVTWEHSLDPWRPGEPVAAKTSFAFVDYVSELFGPLSHGATVVLAGDEEMRRPDLLCALVDRHQVRRIVVVPGLLAALLDLDRPELLASCTSWTTSGEPLPPALAARFAAVLPDARLINLFGASESGGDSLWALVEGAEVTIGTPLANSAAHVLDERLRPLPPGVPGELYLAGTGLALGYPGRPGLTAERFVPDPSGPPGSRMYRTGDLARQRGDGTFVHLGRADDQVKIRGVRGHLSQVDAVLVAHPAVTAAAVTVVDAGELTARLVAYVVLTAAEEEADLAGFVRARLHDQLVPATFVVLDELPSTASGKLDRRALPAPVAGPGGRRPSTPVEDVLCDVFRQTLGVADVGVDDSFFLLGGHSLSAVRLTSRIRSALGVEVDLRTVFASPTPAALARIVAAGAAAPRRSPVPVVRPDRVPLTHAQRRLWFLARLEERSTAYHLPAAFRLRGEVDVDALCLALDDVMARHESLRTSFPDDDGVPHQRVLGSGPRLDVVATDQESLAADLAMAAAHRFDLAEEPPLRAWLFETGPDERVLFLLLHHIGFDGWSYCPLLRELSAAYEARAAGGVPVWPALPVQYADYALWQQEVLDAGVLAEQLAHWTAELADLPARLPLPFGPPGRPAGAGSVPLTVGPDLHGRIGAFAESSGVTVFMVVQAALAALLTRFGAGTDIPIGSPIAGRADESLHDLIGLFVNTLVLRTDTSGDPEFRDLLGRVRAADLAAYAHPDVPFELLVERLNPERSTGTHPLFQVMLSFHNAGDRPELVLPGVTCELLPPAEAEVKFDLSIELVERRDPGGLIGRIVYRAEAFEAETVGALADGLVRMLEAVTERPDVRIGDVDLVGDWSPRHAHLGAASAAHVLDERLRPVPPGVPGELYLAGTGLAMGYPGRPGLTAERFVPDPFGPPGSRMYRTGDLARQRADGTLVDPGTAGDQVKVRGVREHLPLTTSGKTDRRAVPEPPPAVPSASAPLTDVQRQVAEVWQQVLGTAAAIGPDDDFFALGGHSLLVPRLVARLRDRCGVAVPLQRFFAGPTVTALAELIADQR